MKALSTAVGYEAYGCQARSVTVTSAPAAEPVSATLAKLHIKSETSADDSLVTQWIAEARRLVERHTGLALITQTHVARYDTVPESGQPFLLPRAPVQSVSSVVTYDTSNVSSTLAAASYLVDAYSEPARVALNDGYTWPTGLRAINAVEITYVAGYGAAGSSVPEPILSAMLYLIAHRDMFREPVIATGSQPVEMPLAVAYALGPYRLWWV